MSSDSSNPFAKLAQEFAAKNTRKDESDACRKKTPAHSPATVRASSGGNKACSNAYGAAAQQDDDSDAALFLQSVSSIKPLPEKKKNSKGGRALGDELAKRMQENAAQKQSSPSQNASKASAGSTAPTPVSSLSGNDTSDEQMFRLAVGGAKNSTQKSSAAGPRTSSTPDAHSAADSVAPSEDIALFDKAMNGVTPVGGKGRAVAVPPKPSPTGAAHDPAQALRDILEGRVEFTLSHSDEYLEGHVVGIDPLVLAKLRAGNFSPEKHLDMHGMTADQALDALIWFIKDAYQKGLRTVTVVTGRGKNSPDGVGVLRPLLQQWLCKDPFKRVVLAFCTAQPHDGGPGAVYVLLRKYKKSRGKIRWERGPSDDDFPSDW